VSHLNQNIGLFVQGLFFSPPAIGALINFAYFVVWPTAGCMKRTIEWKERRTIVKAQLQILSSKYGSSNIRDSINR
jgi:hypothetical protein